MQFISDRRVRHLAVVEGEKGLGMIAIGKCARSMPASSRGHSFT